MFWPRHYGARYFTRRYFGASEAAAGSIYSTVSASAIVAATLSAKGWAQAGLLGAASVEALLSPHTGSSAAIFGYATVVANLTSTGEAAGGGWRPLRYAHVPWWINQPKLVVGLEAHIRAGATVAAAASAIAPCAAGIGSRHAVAARLVGAVHAASEIAARAQLEGRAAAVGNMSAAVGGRSSFVASVDNVITFRADGFAPLDIAEDEIALILSLAA